MTKLRFEIWDGPLSSECGVVSEGWDRIREADMIFRDAFFASTVDEAMTHYYDQNDWEPYRPMPGVTDRPFTEEQLAEQEAYLKVRPPVS